MAVPGFGRVQLQIMKVLWERGRATAREITDSLNEQEPIAHSTVQTLLRKLEDKKAIAHTRDDRTFVFHPTVPPENVRQKATTDFLNRMFDGSPGGLISYLIKNESISEEEMDAIRNLIEEKEEQDD